MTLTSNTNISTWELGELVMLMGIRGNGSGRSSVNSQVSGRNAGSFRQRASCRGEQDA